VTFDRAISGGYVNTSESYQWLFPGGTPGSSTDSMPTITYNHGGLYDVTLIVNRGGQIDTLAMPGFIYVTPGVGIAEKEQVQVSVYPNPNQGEFTLTVNTPKPFVGDMIITNTLGKTVYQENDVTVNGQLQKNFRLSNLGSGIYFIRLENNTAKGTYKFVIK
jgi:PKD repeat protein